MKSKKHLPERVFKFIEKHNFAEASGLLLVGVSGGADSACLFHILSELRNQLGVKLQAVHFNHMLRGAESDADAEYVFQFSRKLGIPITLGKCDVRALQKKQNCSLEEAAREARYSFFAEVASTSNAFAVAVGHTADDQVETILMHLVRGTGLRGLRGMKPATIWRSPSNIQLKIVRPLLEISREETETYCKSCGIPPRQDSSNQSLIYRRNRFRLELVPLLQNFNPNFRATLLHLSKSVSDDIDFIEKQVSFLWNEVVQEEDYGFVLDSRNLSEVHPSLKRHLLRTLLEKLLGDLRDIEFVHIESMLEMLEKPVNKMVSLPKGTVFYRDYEHCLLLRKNADWCPFPVLEEHRLNIPGETLFSGWRVKGSIFEGKPDSIEDSGFRAFFDFDICREILIVRSRKAGDRFQPLGMSQSKKIQDFMIDTKIPRPWRNRVPLVTSSEHILWIVGWRISEVAKVTGSTKRILLLEFDKR